MKKCLFAGTFDPITTGHTAVIEKAIKLFDEVVVAVCHNTAKKTYFPLEVRLKAVEDACRGYKNVKVMHYEGFVVDLMKSEGIEYNLRGIRNGADYEYETEMHRVNSYLYKGMTTLFLPCETENEKVSSTLVRELIRCGKDFSAFVPTACYGILEEEVKKRKA